MPECEHSTEWLKWYSGAMWFKNYHRIDMRLYRIFPGEWVEARKMEIDEGSGLRVLDVCMDITGAEWCEWRSKRVSSISVRELCLCRRWWRGPGRVECYEFKEGGTTTNRWVSVREGQWEPRGERGSAGYLSQLKRRAPVTWRNTEEQRVSNPWMKTHTYK